MPFGRGGGKKQIVVRKYTALTEGGIRKQYETDANNLAQQGYRPTSTVDHNRRGGWLGGQMIVTYELVQSPPSVPQPVAQPVETQGWARCTAVSPDGWQCALASGHTSTHSTTSR